MTDLASSHALAAAVSAITARICGMTFVPGEAPDRSEAARGRLFIFPVRGRRRFGLLLSCDRPTSVSLTCRMTGGAVDATPGELVEASIRDLLSRVAAGLERALDASPAAWLDLARPRQAAKDAVLSEEVPLRSEDLPGIRLWVVRRAATRNTPDFVSDVARDFQ